MKKIYLVVILLISIAVNCTAQKNYSVEFVNSVIEGKIYPAYYDYIFMYRELIEIYKRDTIKLNRDIDVFDRVKYDKPCNDYYFNIIKSSLKNKLKNYKKDCSPEENIIIIDKVIKALKIDDNMKMPDEYKDWNNFYNCFFEDPGDEKIFSIFTLLFMEENELASFLNHSNKLKYWNSSVILDLTVGGGDFIENNKKNGTNIVFKREAEFILRKWESSKNPIIIKTLDAFQIGLTKSK